MIKKIEQAVILAGGRGKRLGPLTNKVPKPLVKINGIPFCDYLLNSLVKNSCSAKPSQVRPCIIVVLKPTNG